MIERKRARQRLSRLGYGRGGASVAGGDGDRGQRDREKRAGVDELGSGNKGENQEMAHGKERIKAKELRTRLQGLRDKTISLRHQKKELYNKLMEKQATVADLERMQNELQLSLQEKETQINLITAKAEGSVDSSRQLSALTDLLNQKNAEIEELKHQLSEVHQPENILAEDSHTIKNVTALDNTKENEDLEDTTSLTSANASETNATGDETQGINANDPSISHEVNFGNETWVKLETNIEDEDLDKSGIDGSQSVTEEDSQVRSERIEVSQGSETSLANPKDAEEQPEKPKDNEITIPNGNNKPDGAETILEEIEATERHGDSKDIENSQFIIQPNTGKNGVDFTIEQPKSKRRHSKRTKRRRVGALQRDIKLNHDSEHNTISQDVENPTVPKTETDDTGIVEGAASDQPKIYVQLREDSSTNAGSIKDAGKDQTIHPSDETFHENEASKTSETKENNKEDGIEVSSRINLDVIENSSDGTSQDPETGGEIQELGGEEKEVIQGEQKQEDPVRSQDDNNDNNLQNYEQNVTTDEA
ncbi:hypothetical protein ZIOFF_073122 [Zingiber officinale]|uniref:Uncharacterized protein n=1 Tax=Zingiber officinale TaxID=94328 RepID=A0A8J5C8U5_ZINOF|nr:hypothetical protein ZIOFF_073122 [Zingiber officinale]